GDACTTNLCDVLNGECGYRRIEECCAVAADCDDGNACTRDSCAGETCAHDAIAGCCNADTDCNDGDACTPETCDVTANTCSASPIPECCADGTTRPCYEGPVDTLDVGACAGGLETCVGNRWTGLCEGAVLPASSDARDAASVDDDCDGMPNDGC